MCCAVALEIWRVCVIVSSCIEFKVEWKSKLIIHDIWKRNYVPDGWEVGLINKEMELGETRKLLLEHSSQINGIKLEGDVFS